jgi:hypothetical protein
MSEIPDRGPLATPDFKPTPADINTKIELLWDAFDHMETEMSALIICRMAQQRGDWRPFTRADIENFDGRKDPGSTFCFNRLVEPGMTFGIQRGRYLTGGGWIVEKDDLYHFTEDFILRCYRSANSQAVVV